MFVTTAIRLLSLSEHVYCFRYGITEERQKEKKTTNDLMGKRALLYSLDYFFPANKPKKNEHEKKSTSRQLDKIYTKPSRILPTCRRIFFRQFLRTYNYYFECFNAFFFSLSLPIRSTEPKNGLHFWLYSCRIPIFCCCCCRWSIFLTFLYFGWAFSVLLLFYCFTLR